VSVVTGPLSRKRTTLFFSISGDVVALQQSSGKYPHKPFELFAQGPAQRIDEDLPSLNQREADYDISYYLEFGVWDFHCQGWANTPIRLRSKGIYLKQRQLGRRQLW
jgi:hypothetical protein